MAGHGAVLDLGGLRLEAVPLAARQVQLDLTLTAADVAALGALAVSTYLVAPSLASEDAVVIPAPTVDVQPADGIQTAVIAGGCFWGVQGVFQHTAGVVNAVSGYSGGSKATADYNMVSMGTTGHAEAVEV